MAYQQMEEALKQSEIERQQLIAQTQQLQQQTQQVADMFENGVLKQDENGNYVPVMDPNETEHIR